MYAAKVFYVLVCLLFAVVAVRAQDHTIPFQKIRLNDSTSPRHRILFWDSQGGTDLIDVINWAVGAKPERMVDSSKKDVMTLHSALLPGIGYSLQTGFAAVVQYLGGFYTSPENDANQSSIGASVSYTQLHQLLIPFQASVWTPGNKYNIVADWRYLVFPQNTYGLGGFSSLNDVYVINYRDIRLYSTIYRTIAPDLYIGAGFDVDILDQMHEVNPPAGETDFEAYNITNHQTSSSAVSSGPTLDLLYDTRRNSINPGSGAFADVVYRPSLTMFGSTTSWQSLLLDLRRYIPVPINSYNAGAGNLLAIWSYNWLTLDGAPPYVLLPNTGGDAYGNTGRGFTEGRFRGRNMVYLEGEYRFGITDNGLLGGVVFANGETFSEQSTDQFARIYAGYGVGARIKFNKFSKTNVAIDYAFGSDGSRGFFINLGEVF